MLAKHLVGEGRRLFPAIEFEFDADIKVRGCRPYFETQ